MMTNCDQCDRDIDVDEAGQCRICAQDGLCPTCLAVHLYSYSCLIPKED